MGTKNDYFYVRRFRHRHPAQARLINRRYYARHSTHNKNENDYYHRHHRNARYYAKRVNE